MMHYRGLSEYKVKEIKLNHYTVMSFLFFQQNKYFYFCYFACNFPVVYAVRCFHSFYCLKLFWKWLHHPSISGRKWKDGIIVNIYLTTEVIICYNFSGRKERRMVKASRKSAASCRGLSAYIKGMKDRQRKIVCFWSDPIYLGKQWTKWRCGTGECHHLLVFLWTSPHTTAAVYY